MSGRLCEVRAAQCHSYTLSGIRHGKRTACRGSKGTLEAYVARRILNFLRLLYMTPTFWRHMRVR